MRRFALALVAVLIASPTALALPIERHLKLTDADRAELDAISASLNAITTLKGQFYQIEPSGTVDEGQFYLEKPGKVRFEYKPPLTTLLVSDGRTVAVANRKLNTVDRYSLNDTPLRMILSNTIDLRHDPSLLAIEHQDGAVVLKLRTSLNRSKPNLALVFSAPEHELRQWTIIDDQGTTTTVALRALVPGTAIPPTLFVLPEKLPPAPPRSN
jgi:outer membrane lipoprotein-sorting protein